MPMPMMTAPTLSRSKLTSGRLAMSEREAGHGDGDHQRGDGDRDARTRAE